MAKKNKFSGEFSHGGLNTVREAIKENETQVPKHLKDEYGENYNFIVPPHYKQYDVENIDMMERIWGIDEVIIFCKINAFKYRMRAGNKPHQPIERDFAKEKWYLDKMNELIKKKNENQAK